MCSTGSRAGNCLRMMAEVNYIGLAEERVERFGAALSAGAGGIVAIFEHLITLDADDRAILASHDAAAAIIDAMTAVVESPEHPRFAMVTSSGNGIGKSLEGNPSDPWVVVSLS